MAETPAAYWRTGSGRTRSAFGDLHLSCSGCSRRPLEPGDSLPAVHPAPLVCWSRKGANPLGIAGPSGSSYTTEGETVGPKSWDRSGSAS
jgi:hypothetical protein